MKTQKRAIAFAVVSVGVIALNITACHQKRDDSSPTTSVVETTGAPTAKPATWQEVTKDWPENSKSAAKEMAEKYGAPDEMTSSQLLWNSRGPWKKSIVSREEVLHEWPSKHYDVLEQFINYKASPDRVDDIVTFDGSVIVERTKGELSARCGGEAANFLAINLAREVAEGKRSVDDARHFYETTMQDYKAGKKPDYMTRLHFAPPAGGTGDPDRGPLQ